jgi:hypothetical protein
VLAAQAAGEVDVRPGDGLVLHAGAIGALACEVAAR